MLVAGVGVGQGGKDPDRLLQPSRAREGQGAGRPQRGVVGALQVLRRGSAGQGRADFRQDSPLRGGVQHGPQRPEEVGGRDGTVQRKDGLQRRKKLGALFLIQRAAGADQLDHGLEGPFLRAELEP